MPKTLTILFERPISEDVVEGILKRMQARMPVCQVGIDSHSNKTITTSEKGFQKALISKHDLYGQVTKPIKGDNPGVPDVSYSCARESLHGNSEQAIGEDLHGEGLFYKIILLQIYLR